MPLDMLARLEIIPGTMVERSGNQWVTQYRGHILPLIRISHALEERRQPASAKGIMTFPTEETLQVLVLESGGQSVGLVVHKILDIVESAMGVESPPTRAGVLHSSVIEERVTELLDVPAILLAGEAHEPVVCERSGRSSLNDEKQTWSAKEPTHERYSPILHLLSRSAPLWRRVAEDSRGSQLPFVAPGSTGSRGRQWIDEPARASGGRA